MSQISTRRSSSTASTASTNVRAPEGGGTVTLTNADKRIQLFDLTAAETVKLPTAGVLKGDIWEMQSANFFILTVEADDATIIRKINGKALQIIALTDTPATNTDWEVSSVKPMFSTSDIPYTPTFSTNSAVGANSFVYSREADGEYLRIYGTYTLSGTGTDGAFFTFSIPSLGINIDIAGLYSQLGSASNVGEALFFQSPHFYDGFAGSNDATTINMWSGYAAGTTGGNEVRFLRNNDGGTGDIGNASVRVRIVEWMES